MKFLIKETFAPFCFAACLVTMFARPVQAVPVLGAGERFSVVGNDAGFTWRTGDMWTNYSEVPVGVMAGKAWMSLACGERFTVAIDGGGGLWSWGIGPGSAFETPTRFGVGNDWRGVSAKGTHALAVKENGSMWIWGIFTIPGTSQVISEEPSKVGSDSDWKAVSAGTYHNLAIKQNGSLWGWGYNSHGHIGDGTTTNKTTPVRVGTGNDWKFAVCSEHTSLGIKTNGTLWAWGSNSGYYGNGGSAGSVVPVQIGTSGGWSKIEIGYSFVIALKDDGSLWSWGTSTYGLGLGDMTSSPLPSRVGTSNSWAEISAEGQHVVAARTDGSLWMWGRNESGALGIPGLTGSSVPLDVSASYVPVPQMEIKDSFTTLKGDGLSSVSLPETYIGRQTSLRLTVANKGLLPLLITSTTSPADFRVADGPLSIPPLSHTQLEVKALALSDGEISGMGVISSNDPEVPEFSLNLMVRVVSPANDSDGDGMNDAAEVALSGFGFRWQAAQPSLIESLFSNASSAGFYSAASVVEVRPQATHPGSAGLEIPLEILNAENNVRMPLVSEDFRMISERELEIAIPVPPQTEFLRIANP